MDMISLCHIYKQYGTHRVLEDANLPIRQGEIYRLIGKNGAGKTTIFKVILGLTEYEAWRLARAGGSSKQARPPPAMTAGQYRLFWVQ